MTDSRERDAVNRLWALCNALKDDGVTYHQYLSELTYLLYIKMVDEAGNTNDLPAGTGWQQLVSGDPNTILPDYQHILARLGSDGSAIVREIYADATTTIRRPDVLQQLVAAIDSLDWHDAHDEQLGSIYEGLLEKNATDVKSGAGQYFTPRPLIEAVVAVMQPTHGDVIQDPAAGTGGFLVAAHNYIRTRDRKRSHAAQYVGMEHVRDTYRLALMNLSLHGMVSHDEVPGVRYGDTLSQAGADIVASTLILTNPPFGSRKGAGHPTRDDLPYSTTNKQLSFLQHCYLNLQPNGRAAIVVPDSVLYEAGVAALVRQDLMNRCNLHTILRLPTGIFYANGVKTCVLFFTRGEKEEDNTQEVWIYDLRSNIGPFTRRRRLQRSDFADFEAQFGDDPLGRPDSLSRRAGDSEIGSFRPFGRDRIRQFGDVLEMAWLADPESDVPKGGVAELEQMATDILELLHEAAASVDLLRDELGGGRQ